MGYGIYFYPEIYFSHPQWKSLQDVEDAISETKKIINHLETELHSLAIITEPSKYMPQDCDDPLWWLSRRVEEILTDEESGATLKDYYKELFLLEMVRDNWSECHNNDIAIAPPKGSFEKHEAYMVGDFIDSDYENGEVHYRVKRL